MSTVALVKTTNRKEGVRQSLNTLGINPVRGMSVLVKPNFNTADVTPGSTHNDTLEALVEELWAMGARSVSLGERCFPPAREVMEAKGVLPLLKRLDVRVIDTLIEGRDAAEAVARDYATEHHHPPRPAAGHRRQDDRAAA